MIYSYSLHLMDGKTEAWSEGSRFPSYFLEGQGPFPRETSGDVMKMRGLEVQDNIPRMKKGPGRALRRSSVLQKDRQNSSRKWL